MNKIRIGVVGPGIIWKIAHRPALENFGEQVEITAFSASSEKTRREVEQTYPGVPFYSDYHELVTAPQVDWVLVLTPIALNAPVAQAALEAGKNVFLEKPMARSLAEGEALVRLADEIGRRLFVLEQFVYPGYVDTVEQVIRSGEIGEVLMYDQVQSELYDAHSHDATPWRTQANFPLGRLFDGGHHPIARLGRLFGEPLSVYALGRNLRPNYGEYDHVLMLLEHANSVRGSFSWASVLSNRKDYFHIRGTQGILSLERGQTVIDLNDGSSRTIPHVRERDYLAMWRALMAAIAEGREPYYTKERALDTLKTLLAIQHSAQTGSKVTI